MDVILTVLGAYLVVGIIAICLLFILTGKMRKRLKDASIDTQEKMTAKGSYIGTKQAMIITMLALWIFWPVAIYGAIFSSSKGDDSG